MALKPLNSVGGFSVGEIPANVILANADITANKATFNGNVLISPANNAAYGILTDNLYYANGVPWDMQQAAGSNGELQFNLNDDFAASANLVWDNANSNLTITGNANITGTLIAGAIEVDELKNGNSNVAIPVANGNVNISAAGNANILVVTGTGANVVGTFDVTGNANVGNLGTNTAIITTGNITTINSGLLQNGTTNVTLTQGGNVATYVAGNATAQFTVTATGVNVAGYANIVGNANIGNIGTNEINATGNITGANIMGPLANGTSNVSIPVVNGNVNTSVGGVANVQVVTTGGTVINGNLDVTGNTYLGSAGDNQLINLTSSSLEIRGGWDTATGTSVNIVAGDYSNASNWGKLSIQGNVSGNSIGYAEANYFIFSNPGYGSGNVVKVDVLNPNATSTSTGAVQVTGGIGVTGNGHFGGQVVVTGNVTGGNVITGGNIFANTGNIVGANLMGPLANGTSNVYIPAANGNVNTSVGGVANVFVVTTTGANVAGTLNATGNANVGNLGTDTAIITTGNITTINSGLLQNGGSNITLTNNGNVSTYIGGNATAQFVVTSSGANIAGTANVVGNANVGNLGTNQILTTGNISISNAVPTNGILTDNLYYSNGVPWDLQEPAGANTEIQFNNNGQFGASANFTWDTATNLLDINGNLDVSNNAIVQGNVKTPNIQSAGNLTVTTDLAGNAYQFVFTNTGNVVMPGNATIVNNNGNISIQSGALGKYAELLSGDSNTAVWVEDSPDGAFIGGNLTGTPVYWNFKSNGDLVTTPGNITVGANGNIVATTFIGDLEGNVKTTVSNTYVLFSDAGVISGSTGFTFDKISNVFALPGDVTAAGNANITGTANINSVFIENGNISAGANAIQLYSTNAVQLNYNGNTYVIANSLGSHFVANGFVATVDTSGNTSLPNNLSVTGNIANANNISVTNTLTAVTGNFSGNITSLNANLGNLVDANIIRTGELYNGNSNVVIAANGNIVFSATGLANVHTFSKDGINVVGYVEANGNGTFGALYSNTLTAQGGNLTIYAAAGDNYVELRPTGNGQVDVGNFKIQNLGTPTLGADAATKAYVDNAIEGLTWKQAAQLLAVGNVALTGTTNTLVIDGHPALTSADNGYRIVLTNQTTDTEDGIYVYSDTGNGNYALNRSSDADTYQELEGAAIFILEGNTYANTGWTQTNHYLTSFANQQWIQFAGGGAYTGANGISVVGTIISANTDGITTEIAGGNIVVKANAQFTTPNIGAATGTSLDLTGNAQVNNLNSNLKVTTTDLEASGNIIANVISANANLTVNNATVNLELTGNTANFSSNVIVNNLTVNLELQGNTANFDGNVTMDSWLSVANVANVGNLNVVANVTSNLLPNANLTFDVGASTQRWANVYAGNIDASGTLTIAGNTNVTSNVVANNIVANTSIDLGNSAIYWAEVTTTNTTPNQTISTVTISGVTGVEWIVKATDATGSKYSMAMVTAVTDGTSADYSQFGGVNLGGSTGTLSVSVVGSNVELQVTPASSNSTVWVTQYRTI